MKNIIFYLSLITLLGLNACIKDDFVNDRVKPTLRITTVIDSIELGTDFQFSANYLNNVGQKENVSLFWSSNNVDIISINDNGLASALESGNATLTVEHQTADTIFTDTITVAVGNNTVSSEQSTSGTIATTSTYALTGDFTFKENSTGVELIFDDNYNASTSLPGLYVYLSNNKNSVANAIEVSKVETFSGAHSYNIENIGFNDYQFIVYFCKPFNVKVGDGTL